MSHGKEHESMSRHVIRRGGFAESVYLQPDGSWGAYKTAERFVSSDAAEAFHRKFFEGENFGIFPVSVPKVAMKDIFGGTLDDERNYEHGHHWVGVDTSHEHCMTCRQGADVRGKSCAGPPYCAVCGDHLDMHQSGRYTDHVFQRKI